MFKHSDIWRAIDRLALNTGYSASGLAKKAGLDPTTFNKSKRTGPDGKPRWPSTESIAKILSVTGVAMSDFVELVQDSGVPPRRNTRPIPLLGLAKAGRSGYFDNDGYPAGRGWDEISFPEYGSHINDENIYALEVSGDSMEPLYRNGDLLVVAPGARIRKGDRVVLRTRKGEVMVKEMVRQNEKKIELKSLNPDHDDRTFNQREVDWMARVVWVSQ